MYARKFEHRDTHDSLREVFAQREKHFLSKKPQWHRIVVTSNRGPWQWNTIVFLGHKMTAKSLKVRRGVLFETTLKFQNGTCDCAGLRCGKPDLSHRTIFSRPSRARKSTHRVSCFWIKSKERQHGRLWVLRSIYQFFNLQEVIFWCVHSKRDDAKATRLDASRSIGQVG